MSDEDVVIQSRLTEKGISEAYAILTPSNNRCKKIIDFDLRPCIPVIFLPGVMGTNLKLKTGATTWSPPNPNSIAGAVGAIFSLLGWWFRDAGTRQIMLNPADTLVDNRGSIHTGVSGLGEADARKRGWGEVHQSSYHGILAYLQYQLNHPMLCGKPEGDWHSHVKSIMGPQKHSPDLPVLKTAPEQFGAAPGATPLSEVELNHFSRYQYPVHAVGYNWTQSNGDSAKAVYERIKTICKQYGKGTKAIIVTHSMGGIVARSIAAQFVDHEDYIYGVLHGAQPATGAPMAAKRFRTGAEDFAGKRFFGSDDGQWTAVAASSPAALELMPMPDYKDGRPWWVIKDAAGKIKLALPRVPGNAAEEIYKSKAWYGLIPEQNNDLFDPAGIIRKDIEKSDESNASPRDIYEKLIDAAKKFQETLVKKYHCYTYVLYGDGPLPEDAGPDDSKPAKSLLSYGTVVWKGNLPWDVDEADLLAATLNKDDHQGGWQILVKGQPVDLQVQGPDEPGDGTVPANSAAAQAGCEGVQKVFKQGGYDHQFAYNHPWARWASLYLLAQIAQLIPEPATARKRAT